MCLLAPLALTCLFYFYLIIKSFTFNLMLNLTINLAIIRNEWIRNKIIINFLKYL